MVSHLKTFACKGCKIAAQKKFFLANFALIATIRIGREIQCLPSAGFLFLTSEKMPIVTKLGPKPFSSFYHYDFPISLLTVA